MPSIPFKVDQRVLFSTGGEWVEAVVIGVSAVKYGDRYDVEYINIEIVAGYLAGSQFPTSVEKLREMSQEGRMA